MDELALARSRRTDMESHRQERRMIRPRARQGGVTALGFLILVSVFGVIGLATMKLTPLYLQNMRLATLLNDLKEELDGTGPTPASIRISLSKRFDIEGLRVPADDVKINQIRNGYQVRIQHENRAPFIADIWFLVAFDRQVEIQR
jgi:hypothetical protein